MLTLLLAKDFRRVWRNPWPWVLNLGLPLAMTALFGIAFGGGQSEKIAKIKVAVVDEDQSIVGSLFRFGLTQGEGADRFQVTYPNRTNAVQALTENQLSAVIIVPTNFTSDFLRGRDGIKLELLKNPSERIYPAIVEELMGVAVTGLNAIHRNLSSEFPRIEASVTNDVDLAKLGDIMKDVGNRVRHAGDYLRPPLVQYEEAVVKNPNAKPARGMSVFAFILPGVASAFLLFLADHGMRDVHRETRARTFDRIRSVRTSILEFVTAKVLFAAVSVVLGSAILFLGSGLIFRIEWRRPDLLAVICVSYGIFAAGFAALLVAWIANERKAEMINNIVFFAIAFAGGSYFPAEQLPKFMQDHVCPWLPNYWFIESVRRLQSGAADQLAVATVLKLVLAGLVMAVIASTLLNKRLTKGGVH